ncbi:DUF134 domain-containing protein [Methanobacterium formicicum]|uniref:DUF134 domain-containing protein n=1 Tax=Methanobacterium formicicum TaxID=2162 RepID=UPI0023F57338|nr:DUF134 domain-containing protein [Methanobacterium formicicum]
MQCFTPDGGDITQLKSLQITVEEFEALRLRDYQEIQQKKAAEIMDISQPTFHRTISSARKKVSRALVEGKIIQIKGGDYVMDKKRYQCKNCGFEWHSPSKEYEKCPDCDSENIELITMEESFTEPTPQTGLGRRRGGQGARGMGGGPPRVCKCPQCGYESPKTPGVPCRDTKCPKCGIPLCGAD